MEVWKMTASTVVNIPNYTIGADALTMMPQVVQKYGDRILIIGGKTGLEKSRGKIEQALGTCADLAFHSIWYGGECTYENMETPIKEVEKRESNLILGVGGGKAIDTAKGVAEKMDMPVITIPTIASTCAATTALSIVYTEKGDFADLYYLKHSPVHIFIDTTIIAESPWKYQWAGIGDAMAKFYETKATTRDKTLSHSVQLGKQISSLCAAPMLEYGVKAVQDNKDHIDSDDLREVVLNSIISTGLVSILIGAENNGAAAHGLFYGMTMLPEIEQHHLHGEVVAYGILFLLMMDEDREEVRRLYPFFKEMGWPTCLKDLNLSREDISEAVVEKALGASDMGKMPYEVTREMVVGAIEELETFKP
jgi:glycerol dehydrogenase-like iron-containing ADH family enzyme